MSASEKASSCAAVRPLGEHHGLCALTLNAMGGIAENQTLQPEPLGDFYGLIHHGTAVRVNQYSSHTQRRFRSLFLWDIVVLLLPVYPKRRGLASNHPWRSGKWNPNTEGGYRNLIYNHIIPGIGRAELTELPHVFQNPKTGEAYVNR